ncbi:hypothetical protein SNOG_10455 [Parastagonospora nodorum SN15]|uniref:Uncharacterized protein n=1 Tax=Phaeosphaeria nodorum (strain SN15 / ATCC MYA-4574 / FGSC 10173) TaxID=321614 RepID=Q0UCQ9_PHANO|nr:hypothetical protein SNOG_10455 [Parastagonospora nodorum SN15]EAT81849.1 hypothetical protein SNOG_10455 [Parastagonospora nodorum SN15]
MALNTIDAIRPSTSPLPRDAQWEGLACNERQVRFGCGKLGATPV